MSTGAQQQGHSAAQIEADAAGWVMRGEEGMDAADEAALAAWLGQDPAHAQAFERMEQAWGGLAALAGAPEMMAWREEALRPPRARLAGLRGWPMALAASLIVAVAGLAGWSWLRPGAEPAPLVLASGHGEQHTFALGDGSAVTVDAESQVTVRMGAGQRDLSLDRGQAYFRVAHDSARPFVVTAGSQAVVALGTEFSVRRDPETITVALTEGRVRVGVAAGGSAALRPDSGQGGTELTRGQALIYDARSGVSRLAGTKAADLADWRQGRLHFERTPLASVVADFNRYGTSPIRLDDPSLGALPVSGVFSVDNRQGLLAALPLLYPVRIETRADGVVIRRAR